MVHGSLLRQFIKIEKKITSYNKTMADPKFTIIEQNMYFELRGDLYNFGDLRRSQKSIHFKH